ncbi:hypothetical protein QJS10_CPB15g01207 [Acorus calamus]|uniref:Uncharacterized protein n=1 Tax=Acorus calamus TaxID=4465 RepID=A0AAV9D4F1_ACOCL|nr:hypothetical protein QJS10_CPB15g01207 [Acorus calamus]
MKAGVSTSKNGSKESSKIINHFSVLQEDSALEALTLMGNGEKARTPSIGQERGVSTTGNAHSREPVQAEHESGPQTLAQAQTEVLAESSDAHCEENAGQLTIYQTRLASNKAQLERNRDDGSLLEGNVVVDLTPDGKAATPIKSQCEAYQNSKQDVMVVEAILHNDSKHTGGSKKSKPPNPKKNGAATSKDIKEFFQDLEDESFSEHKKIEVPPLSSPSSKGAGRRKR